MLAIEISKPGGPEVLVPVERPKPELAPGEVLIKVEAAGVNRPDVMQRMGHYPPPPGASDIPGLEVAGVIVKIAHGVGEWRMGDRVCALVAGGGYAEFCVVPAPQCLPVPRGMDFVQAAAIPETFFTVWTNVFDRGRLQPGESMLVHGGSSGIGTTAIQLAHARGSRVFATAGSADKCAACERLGAEKAINYRESDFVAAVKELTNGRGVDLILDMVGGDYLPRNIEALAIEGRLVQIGLLGGYKAQLNLIAMMQRRVTHDRIDAPRANDRGKRRDRRGAPPARLAALRIGRDQAGDSRDVSAAVRGGRAPRDGLERAHRQARAGGRLIPSPVNHEVTKPRRTHEVFVGRDDSGGVAKRRSWVSSTGNHKRLEIPRCL